MSIEVEVPDRKACTSFLVSTDSPAAEVRGERCCDGASGSSSDVRHAAGSPGTAVTVEMFKSGVGTSAESSVGCLGPVGAGWEPVSL